MRLAARLPHKDTNAAIHHFVIKFPAERARDIPSPALPMECNNGVFMIFDLHTHCLERSRCSRIPEQQLIEEAIASGMDGLVISDHHRYVDSVHLKELQAQYAPFLIFSGIEMTIPRYGNFEGEDILLIGVREPAFEDPSRDWTYAELYAAAKEQGGFLALCHPYRYHDTVTIDYGRMPPDAVELHSSNIGRCDEALISSLIQKIGCHAVQNSDTHHPNMVGMYHQVLHNSVSSEAELIRELKAGNFFHGCFPHKIEAFNNKVAAREETARTLIAQGYTAQEYTKATGLWSGYYGRVKMGKSYLC